MVAAASQPEPFRTLEDTSIAPIRVVCVDDLADITQVLSMMIDAAPPGNDGRRMKCVACLHNANELTEVVRRLEPCPDVVVLDASMPGKDSFEALRELVDACPTVKTIIYSGYDSRDFVDRAFDAGAWGCVSKSDEPQEIVRAVREVACGNTYFPGSPQHAMPRADS